MGETLRSGGSSSLLLKEELRALCSQNTVANVSEISWSELAAKEISDEQLVAAANCKDALKGLEAATWVGVNSTGYSTLYHYEVTNNGSVAAEKIRIDAKDVFAIQVRQGDGFRRMTKQRRGSFYELPDLNPGEALDVLIWSEEWNSEQALFRETEFPKVTFSGRRVDFRIKREVSEFWYEVSDFFDTFPLVVGVILLISFSFVITLGVVFLFAFADAVVKGKPISDLFETAPSKNS
ncbi:MAG: hypothetical protein AAGI28_16240 [Pseudomonadota bacterium]